MIDWKSTLKEIEVGKGRKIKDGEGIAILSFGHPGNFVLSAQKTYLRSDPVRSEYTFFLRIIFYALKNSCLRSDPVRS